MITPYQMEQIKCKFFQYDVGYKKFQGITTERLEEIKKDIERFEEITFDPKRSKYEGKLDRYYRILAHLTTRRDYTFDEKVAFVIMACDPNQVLYVDYKKFDIQSNASIEKIEDQEEKIAAKQYNDMLITELASGVRDKIGFYDISRLVSEARENIPVIRNPSLEEILAADAAARRSVLGK